MVIASRDASLWYSKFIMAEISLSGANSIEVIHISVYFSSCSQIRNVFVIFQSFH